MSRISSRFTYLIAIIILIITAYVLFWYILAQGLKQQVISNLENLKDNQELSITYDTITVSGFPFSFEVNLNKPIIDIHMDMKRPLSSILFAKKDSAPYPDHYQFSTEEALTISTNLIADKIGLELPSLSHHRTTLSGKESNLTLSSDSSEIIFSLKESILITLLKNKHSPFNFSKMNLFAITNIEFKGENNLLALSDSATQTPFIIFDEFTLGITSKLSKFGLHLFDVNSDYTNCVMTKSFISWYQDNISPRFFYLLADDKSSGTLTLATENSEIELLSKKPYDPHHDTKKISWKAENTSINTEGVITQNAKTNGYLSLRPGPENQKLPNILLKASLDNLVAPDNIGNNDLLYQKYLQASFEPYLSLPQTSPHVATTIRRIISNTDSINAIFPSMSALNPAHYDIDLSYTDGYLSINKFNEINNSYQIDLSGQWDFDPTEIQAPKNSGLTTLPNQFILKITSLPKLLELLSGYINNAYEIYYRASQPAPDSLPETPKNPPLISKDFIFQLYAYLAAIADQNSTAGSKDNFTFTVKKTEGQLLPSIGSFTLLQAVTLSEAGLARQIAEVIYRVKYKDASNSSEELSIIPDPNQPLTTPVNPIDPNLTITPQLP